MAPRFAALLNLVLVAAAAFDSSPKASSHRLADLRLRASQGLGRDTKCVEPPPPLRNIDSGSSLFTSETAPSHLKYLGLDGGVGDDVSWSSWGFMSPGSGWNTTRLERQKANKVAMMVNFQGITIPQCSGNATCWRRLFIGPNATVGGLWNTTIEPAVKKKLIMGLYIGDEILGCGMLVSELTAVFDLCKAVWPEGITYCECTARTDALDFSRAALDGAPHPRPPCHGT
eukprot:SAG31_NODE_4704_length_3021_cov_4.117043_4_plen_229_part_00